MKMLLKFVFCVAILASCVTASAISGRIFNGETVTEIVPYHAQLRISNSLSPSQFLGSGTLVSLRHVLTAALNVVGFNQWQAGFGSLNVNQLTYFTATGAVIHEDYTASNTLNNIAVIFFGIGVIPSNNPNIAPIALPQADEVNPISGSFTAFGFTQPGASPSNVLLRSMQSVLPQSNCDSLFTFGNLSGQFCGIDLQTFSSPCAGEQGAAFVTDTEDGPVAVGLVSATIGQCDTIQAVTFYIRISDYRPWLSTRFGI